MQGIRMTYPKKIIVRGIRMIENSLTVYFNTNNFFIFMSIYIDTRIRISERIYHV